MALAEVEAAGELAHDGDVDALDDLGAQGGGPGQRAEDLDRAQVGVEAQLLADAQQALLGAGLGAVGGVPLGAAHGGEQHGVARAGDVEGLGGQGVAGSVDGAAADEGLLEAELGTVLSADGLEHLDALGHDLRADAVALQDADLELLGHG